jgi:WD40 repeat protein
MLRAWAPELSFHDSSLPILSLDSHPSGRFFTAGTHPTIRVWRLDDSVRDADDCPHLEFLSQLPDSVTLLKAVNVVRVSPSGDLLAAGGDNCAVILYSLHPQPTAVTADSCPIAEVSGEEERVGDGSVDTVDMEPVATHDGTSPPQTQTTPTGVG